jgi:hypothetical protein
MFKTSSEKSSINQSLCTLDGTKGHRIKNKLKYKMNNKMKLTLKFFIINVRIKGMSFGYLPNNHPNLIKAASHVMSKPLT